jgi:hypothetical protein
MAQNHRRRKDVNAAAARSRLADSSALERPDVVGAIVHAIHF